MNIMGRFVNHRFTYLLIILFYIAGGSGGTPIHRPMTTNTHDDQNTLMAFDCSRPGVYTQVIDLMEISSCPSVKDPQMPRDVSIQLIQTDPQSQVSVSQCSVFKTITLVRCGMHSHQMILRGPSIDNPVELSTQDCMSMIKTLRWEYKSQTFVSLASLNSTTKFSDVEMGSVDEYGDCTGSTIKISGVTFKSSFFLVEYKVRVSKYTATLDSSSDAVYLENGLRCTYTDGSCFDSLNGLAFWDQINSRGCENTNIYDVYCGHATIVSSSMENIEGSLIRVNQSLSVFFTSRINKMVSVCGHMVYSTDFQDIYFHIVESDAKNLIEAPQLPSRFIKPLLYTNVKISYLQYKLYDDLRSIYSDVINQICKVEYQTLENKINLARLTNGVLHHLVGFGDRGTFIQIKGEVAHLVKCPSEQVILREEDKCYDAIPVTRNGTRAFVLPVSRVIVDKLPPITCSPITPVIFQLGSNWISFNPHYSVVQPPEKLHPQSHKNLDLNPIRGFSEGGIYSPKAINQFYASLSEKNSREAMMTHIIDNFEIHDNGKIHISDALSEASWNTILKRNMSHMWGWLVGIGEFLSGFLAIYIIWSVVKYIINVLIRGIDIYRMEGCTRSMIASVSSLGHNILKLIKRRSDNVNITQSPVRKPETSVKYIPVPPMMDTISPEV